MFLLCEWVVNKVLNSVWLKSDQVAESLTERGSRGLFLRLSTKLFTTIVDK